MRLEQLSRVSLLVLLFVTFESTAQLSAVKQRGFPQHPRFGNDIRGIVDTFCVPQEANAGAVGNEYPILHFRMAYENDYNNYVKDGKQGPNNDDCVFCYDNLRSRYLGAQVNLIYAALTSIENQDNSITFTVSSHLNGGLGYGRIYLNESMMANVFRDSVYEITGHQYYDWPANNAHHPQPFPMIKVDFNKNHFQMVVRTGRAFYPPDRVLAHLDEVPDEFMHIQASVSQTQPRRNSIFGFDTLWDVQSDLIYTPDHRGETIVYYSDKNNKSLLSKKMMCFEQMTKRKGVGVTFSAKHVFSIGDVPEHIVVPVNIFKDVNQEEPPAIAAAEVPAPPKVVAPQLTNPSKQINPTVSNKNTGKPKEPVSPKKDKPMAAVTAPVQEKKQPAKPVDKTPPSVVAQSPKKDTVPTASIPTTVRRLTCGGGNKEYSFYLNLKYIQTSKGNDLEVNFKASPRKAGDMVVANYRFNKIEVKRALLIKEIPVLPMGSYVSSDGMYKYLLNDDVFIFEQKEPYLSIESEVVRDKKDSSKIRFEGGIEVRGITYTVELACNSYGGA